jgi:hypothetical protein
VVDSLSVRVVVDSVFDQFMPKGTHSMCTIEHVGRIRNNLNSTLAGEWGLSLHLESQAGGATVQYLLDFGYTPEILVGREGPVVTAIGRCPSSQPASSSWCQRWVVMAHYSPEREPCRTGSADHLAVARGAPRRWTDCLSFSMEPAPGAEVERGFPTSERGAIADIAAEMTDEELKIAASAPGGQLKSAGILERGPPKRALRRQIIHYRAQSGVGFELQAAVPGSSDKLVNLIIARAAQPLTRASAWYRWHTLS